MESVERSGFRRSFSTGAHRPRDCAGADAVIQESSMQFLLPVVGELRACSVAPAEGEPDKFHKMLMRAGRGRIRLRVEMHQGQNLAGVFDGLFAAAMRP
jgi:thioesterase domain-containing protein